MSRPTLLTEELQAEICGYIESGNPFNRACILSGISETIFYSWKRTGDEDEKNGKSTIYSEFLQSIKKAEEKFKAWNVAQIMSAGKDKNHWQACAWLLERKYFDEFGKKEKLEHFGEIKTIDPRLAAMTVEELQTELKKLQEDVEK